MDQLSETRGFALAQHLVRLRDGKAWDASRGRPFGERAALAALRHSLGRPPGEDFDIYPYLGSCLPAGNGHRDLAVFIVAGLFGLWPDGVWARDSNHRHTNFGASLRQLASASDGPGVERRFLATLNAPFEELPVHLRHLVALCRSKGVPVDWGRLTDDLGWWESDDRRIQRAWARSFFWQEDRATGDAQRNDVSDEPDESEN